MSVLGIVGLVLVGGLVIIAFLFLNKGPVDKESDRREAYWRRYQGK